MGSGHIFHRLMMKSEIFSLRSYYEIEVEGGGGVGRAISYIVLRTRERGGRNPYNI